MSILCSPRGRCNRWRECARCARIRQAKIADTVEARLARNHYLSYVVLKTNSPLTLESDKARLLRSVRDISSGGVWTVEVGEEFKGLHVNLIIASEKPLRVSRLRKTWGDLGDVYCEPVYGWRDYWERVDDQLDPRGRPVYKEQLDDLYVGWANTRKGAPPGMREYQRAGDSVRRLAAYCSKQEGMPGKDQYTGRVYGNWGSCQSKAPVSVRGVMTGERMQRCAPVVSGLALLRDLEKVGAVQAEWTDSAGDLVERLEEAAELPGSEDFAFMPGRGIVHRSTLPRSLEIKEKRVVRSGWELKKTPTKPTGKWEKMPDEGRPESDQKTGQAAIDALKNMFAD